MADYRNALQYGSEVVQWDPAAQIWSGAQQTAPGYVTELLGLRDRVQAGQAQPWEVEQYQQYLAEAQALPTRDIASLTAGWQGDLQGQWTDSGWQAGNQDWWTSLDPGSPDVGPILLGIRDRMDAGTATDQERALFDQVYGMAGDWNYRASVPQASDANPFGMGDQFMMALAALTAAAGGAASLGAFGAAGAAGAGAGAAGGAAAGAGSAAPSLLGVPLSTLSTIGQIGTYGGMGANVLGSALDQPWLQQLGLGLGVTGGLAGGLAGLGNVFNTGVNSLTDAARLASSAGRLTGAVGRASGVGPLQQASRYLGQAGQLGSLGAGLLPTSVTDWSGDNSPLAANVNPGLDTSADWRTQRGGPMGEYDWLNLNLDPNYGGDMGGAGVWAGGSPMFDESGGLSAMEQWEAAMGAQPSSSWYQDVGQYIGGSDPSGGGNWLSTLGGLGSSALGFLGRNAGTLGPLLSGAGSLASGALGANASQGASAAQTAALNRGIDLQTAQWLQQQANQAPWLQAGQQALPWLQQLAHQGAPAPFTPTAVINPQDYTPGLPGTTPGWTPQQYAGYTPTETPSAAGYRYTPGQVPSAANYRYTPGQVPTLSGQELLANDPGYQFRQDEARRTLEASAAARGGLTSGATLSALQRQSQDLASQEYGNAWTRAAEQARLREGWAQQASQMGWTQAESEARLREQLNQVSSAQNWQQALAEAQARQRQQEFGWNAGFSAQQQGQREAQAYDTDLYSRLLKQNELQYGRDQTYNQTLNDRALQAYNSQNAQQTTDWNRWAALAGYGPQAAQQLASSGQASQTQLNSLLGQLGSSQAIGQLGAAANWNRGIGGATNNLSDLLAGLNR